MNTPCKWSSFERDGETNMAMSANVSWLVTLGWMCPWVQTPSGDPDGLSGNVSDGPHPHCSSAAKTQEQHDGSWPSCTPAAYEMPYSHASYNQPTNGLRPQNNCSLITPWNLGNPNWWITLGEIQRLFVIPWKQNYLQSQGTIPKSFEDVTGE